MPRALPVAFLVLCLLPPAARTQVINEFVVNHSGADVYEFLEVSGPGSTDLSDLTILEIDGDSTGNPGLVESAWPVGTTDGDGIWWTGFLGDEFPTNDSLSFVLVRNFDGDAGLTDIDPDDDGVAEVTPWTEVLDAVGVDDGDATDSWYGGATRLAPFFDGVHFVPAGASRIPSGTDTDLEADWTRNDFDGAGLPLGGTVGAGEAANTPGLQNSTELPPPPPPLISEVILDHLGTDTFETIEIFGRSETDYSDLTLLVVDGTAQGAVTHVVPAGTTNVAGFWALAPGSETFPDFSTLTVLLVSGSTATVGGDVDLSNDGSIDNPLWTEILDSVAFSDGVSFVYSPAELVLPAPRSAPAADGASRFPWFEDTDTAGDWVLNDFDGAGLDGFVGTIGPGEAYNTPGLVNRIHVPDLYASVDASTPETLRASLHEVIDDHIKHPYSSSTSTDTWDILESADEDPDDPSSILDVYRNASIPKFGGGAGPYNREHSWPKTYGFPDDLPTASPHTDCHHLFLSDPTYNSDRGSRPFATCDASCSEDPTLANGGVGGGGGSYPGWSNWFESPDGSDGTWETWLDRRGDVARAQFYMDVRYEGGVHGETGVPEIDLVLTDDRGLIQSTDTSPAYMGLLSVLLQWHEQDPVDARELRRNDEVAKHQGNRNPFIDHPEWVGCVFLGEDCGGLFRDGFESGSTSEWSQ